MISRPGILIPKSQKEAALARYSRSCLYILRQPRSQLKTCSSSCPCLLRDCQAVRTLLQKTGQRRSGSPQVCRVVPPGHLLGLQAVGNSRSWEAELLVCFTIWQINKQQKTTSKWKYVRLGAAPVWGGFTNSTSNLARGPPTSFFLKSSCP